MRRIMCCLLLATTFNTAYGSDNADMDEYVFVHTYGGQGIQAPFIIDSVINNDNPDLCISFFSILDDCRKELKQPTKEITLSPPEFIPVDINLNLASINHVVELLNGPNRKFCAIS